MLDFAFLRDDFILQQALPIDYICPKRLSLSLSSHFYFLTGWPPSQVVCDV